MSDSRRGAYQLPSIGNVSPNQQNAVQDNGSQVSNIDANNNSNNNNNNNNNNNHNALQTPSPSNDYSSVIDSTLTGSALNDHHVATQLIGKSKVTKPDISDLSPDRKHLHIKSEQRRRERITDGFSQLRSVVPTVRSGADSKALVLKKSAEYIEALEYEVNHLKNQLVALEHFYKNNGNFNNNGGSNSETHEKDQGNLDENDKENSESKDSQNFQRGNSANNNNNDNNHNSNSNNSNGYSHSGSPQMFVPPPPGHYPFMPGFVPGIHHQPPPPMFPYNGPIIGTPFPSQPQHHPSPTPPGQPSPALMHPTVPYYFAEDFKPPRGRNNSTKGSLKEEQGKKQDEPRFDQSGSANAKAPEEINVDNLDGDTKESAESKQEQQQQQEQQKGQQGQSQSGDLQHAETQREDKQQEEQNRVKSMKAEETQRQQELYKEFEQQQQQQSVSPQQPSKEITERQQLQSYQDQQPLQQEDQPQEQRPERQQEQSQQEQVQLQQGADNEDKMDVDDVDDVSAFAVAVVTSNLKESQEQSINPKLKETK